jgi:hypothetical protein
MATIRPRTIIIILAYWLLVRPSAAAKINVRGLESRLVVPVSGTPGA